MSKLSNISSTSSSNSEEYLEELDSDFQKNVKIAKSIIKDLKRPKDREIGVRLLERILRLNTNSLEVKASRNKFFTYFIKVLEKNKELQPPIYDEWFKSKEAKEVEETSLWSQDKRTFVSTKTIPGFGLLVYMAVTYEPDLGWVENGFLNYNFMNE